MSPRVAELHIRLAKVLNKKSALVSPDPFSVRAFISEFERGKMTGSESRGVAVEQVALDKIAEAVDVLKDLTLRMAPLAQEGTMAINERRLADKVSSIFSVVFYQMGLLRGLRQTG